MARCCRGGWKGSESTAPYAWWTKAAASSTPGTHRHLALGSRPSGKYSRSRASAAKSQTELSASRATSQSSEASVSGWRTSTRQPISRAAVSAIARPTSASRAPTTFRRSRRATTNPRAAHNAAATPPTAAQASVVAVGSRAASTIAVSTSAAVMPDATTATGQGRLIGQL